MTSMNLRRVQDAEVDGKRVLLRAGLNVPVENGIVRDDFRIRRALPTLQHIASRGAKVVIVAHLGREGDSLQPVFEKLKSMTAIPMQFHDGSPADAGGKIAVMQNGTCLMLQNIRREKGEEENDPALAKMLASLGDVFVNDAFADSHRAHASIVGVASLLPSYAGLLIQAEVEHLSQALVPPPGALAIIGGAKFETKEPLIKKLLPLYGEICVGGALSNDFLMARGFNVGASKISDKPVPQELAHDSRIHIEMDMLVLGLNSKRTVTCEQIAADERIIDAGPQTAKLWSEKITQAPLVLWNGPLGVYEDGYVEATDMLAEALAKSVGKGIVGGGDTIAALAQFTFDESRVFCSTGGGAMLEFLADGTLVGLEPLKA